MSAGAFRGQTLANGFVIDVSLLGVDEARRRVVALWRRGLALRALPDGQWLVLLPQPIAVRAELAPGLPLVSGDGGWSTSDGIPSAGTVAFRRGGTWTTADVAALPSVSPDSWVVLGDIRVHTLMPVDRPAAAAALGTPEQGAAPALREAAGVRPRGGRSDRFARALDSDAQRAATRGGAAGGQKAGTSPRHLLSDWMARATLRSPAAGWLTRRHRQYLEQLTAQLRRGDWDDALRDAIPIGGGGSTLNLRLPSRRTGALRPSSGRRTGGGTLPVGQTMQQTLTAHYQRAAEMLEGQGKYVEAAFVHADLLGNPRLAAAVLERGREFRLAAEVAEGHALDGDLVVRLWWRAGNRDRAVTVARTRGAFALAVQRLEPLDATAATSLRAEWVAACALAGDHLAAVEAAWPAVTLRSSVMPQIERGIARGGPTAAIMFAYLASYLPGGPAHDMALALLASRGDPDAAARAAFALRFAELACGDPAADRRLATAAVRALYVDAHNAAGQENVVQRDRAMTSLKKRADRLAVADLPARPRSRLRPGADLHAIADDLPGQAAVHDAVSLPGRVVVVANGEAGTRLVTVDGRPRAQWDVPADRIIVADHAGSVLMVADQGGTLEIHHLDLVTRRVTRRPPLRVQTVVDTFDGSMLVVVDEDGLALVDISSDRPRVLWREFDARAVVHAVSRAASGLSALVSVGDSAAGRETEMWTWTLPGMELRRRIAVNDSLVEASVLLDNGQRCTIESGEEGRTLRWRTEALLRGIRLVSPYAYLVGSGPLAAVGEPGEDCYRLHLTGGDSTEPATTVTFPVADASLRRVLPILQDGRIRTCANVVTVSSRDGRVVVLDRTTRELVSRFRTTA